MPEAVVLWKLATLRIIKEKKVRQVRTKGSSLDHRKRCATSVGRDVLIKGEFSDQLLINIFRPEVAQT